VQKPGKIRFSDPGVYDVRMYTAVVGHFTRVILVMFARGRHCYRHCGDQKSGVFHSYSLGAILLNRAGYTLGSVTHF